MCFYGPGSAFSKGILRGCEPREEPLHLQCFETPDISDVPVSVMQECIELFFKWQVPYCNIIDRERFWAQYSSGVKLGEGDDASLLHTMCSLGALMSNSQHVRSLAPQFAAAAEFEISRKFWIPHLTTCQAMLLLAVFESGRGELAKTWSYSGSTCHESWLRLRLHKTQRHSISNGPTARYFPIPFASI